MVDGNAVLWARKEFGGVVLGDERRNRRLSKIACGVAQNVGGPISMCCGTMAAQLVSRFFDRKEVTLDSVLESHIEQTVKRCAGVERVLAVQDTCYLDFTSHIALEGLGHITSSPDSKGLLMHSILAVDIDRLPLGILGINIWARKTDEYGKKATRKQREVKDKESNKWLIGLRQAESALPEDKPLLVIGDRESDFFALFAAKRRPNTDLLVRAAQNRVVVDPEYRLLYEALEGAGVLGEYELDVPRQGKRKARKAKMQVKAFSVTIKPPANRTPDIPDEPVEVYCVCAREIDVPEGVTPLNWILLTTLPVKTMEDALYIIRAYSVRWVIEEFHKVLKSGCKVENLQFETLERMIPAIGVLSVVAWRVLYISKWARTSPDAAATEIATGLECKVLRAWMKKKRKRGRKIETVRDFVRAVAMLGGFMGRKSDGEPGTKTLWQGLRRLEDLVTGYSLSQDAQ